MARTDGTLQRGTESTPHRHEGLRDGLWWILAALIPVILFAVFVAVVMAMDHMMHMT